MKNNNCTDIKISESGEYNIYIVSKKINNNMKISDKNLYGELCINLRSILYELYEDPKIDKYKEYKWKKENKDNIASIKVNINDNGTIVSFIYTSLKPTDKIDNLDFYQYCLIEWRDNNSIYEVLNNLDKIID